MTQEDLATAAGITRRMVAAYEAEKANPPGTVLPKLAHALGISIDELFGYTASEPAEALTDPLGRGQPGKKRRKKPVAGTNLTHSFGTRLAALRRARGLTQRDLAAAAGISQRMIAYYEAQKTFAPWEAMRGIARALQLSMDELFGLKRTTPEDIPTDIRLWRKFRLVERLSARDRQAVLRHIRGLIKDQANGDDGSTSSPR